MQTLIHQVYEQVIDYLIKAERLDVASQNLHLWNSLTDFYISRRQI